MTKVNYFVLAIAFGLCNISSAEPTVFRTGKTISHPNKIQQGWTIYSSYISKETYMLDHRGKVIETWTSQDPSYFYDYMFKPLNNGNLLGWINASIPNRPGQRRLVELSPENQIVWQWLDDEGGFSHIHHDFQRLENGNTLLIKSLKLTREDISVGRIKEDRILEITPAGEVIWEWSTLSNYNDLSLNNVARDQILTMNRLDIFHTNSVREIPEVPYVDACIKKGNILVSQRTTNLIFIVDKVTRSICWQLKQTIGQHHASIIPPDHPGWGNLLVFDNGGLAGYPEKRRFYSMVKEFNPISKDIVWEYNAFMSKRPLKSFFSGSRGGAQRLLNGNTLIVEAERGRIFEINSKGTILWEFIDPHFDSTGDRDFKNLVYRAYRVDYTWPTSNSFDINAW